MAVFLLPLVAAIVIYQYRSHDAVDILAVTDGQLAATSPEGIQVDAPLRAVVSEDRRTVAYVGHRGNEQCICINGSVSRCANEIGTIVISGDGSRVAWAEAKRNPLTDQVKWHVVADGSDGPEYQEIRNLQMAAGSGRVAYLAHSEKGWHFVFGGSTSPAYASIPWSALSPDGARSFYAAFVDNRLIPFLDGAAGPPFDQGFAYSFSANGRHFAYLGRDTDGKFLMVDGQRTQASSELSDVTLNADGSRLLRTMKSPAGVWFTEGDRSSPVFRTQQAGVMFTRSSGDIFVSVITAGTPSFQEQIWRSDNVTKLRRSRSSELVTRYRNEWLRTMRVDLTKTSVTWDQDDNMAWLEHDGGYLRWRYIHWPATNVTKIDMASREPGLNETRDAILSAIRDRSVDRLLAYVDPNVRVGFGDPCCGVAFFRSFMNLDNSSSPFWERARGILENGGLFSQQGGNVVFTAPYTYGLPIQVLGPLFGTDEIGLTTGGQTKLRSQPHADGPVLRDLHREAVGYSGQSEEIFSSGWTRVRTWDGLEGYVERDRMLATMYDYRIFFEKHGDRWVMTAFVSGD
jgi:hypothetical protein